MFTYIDLFAGIGGFSLAAQQTKQFKCLGYSEIDNRAIKVYDDNFKHDKLGDITKIVPSELPDIDFVFGGAPCFTAGHLVMTLNGYKKIEDISNGDYVLTHKGRYKKVINIGSKIANTWLVSGMGIPNPIETTEEHPFYVRKKIINNHKRTFLEPEWVETKKLNTDYYTSIVSSPINNSNSKYSKSFWYMIGRYTGDGWYCKYKRKNRKNSNYYKFIICCGKDEFDELNKIFNDSGKNFSYTEERTGYKFTISNKELVEFVEPIGRGASNKKIHPLLFQENNDNINAFLNGLFDSDGHIDKQSKNKVITSTSKELILGVQFIINKLNLGTSNITKYNATEKTFIEDREVNQKPFYQIYWKDNKGASALAFKDDIYTWMPLRKIEKTNHCKQVYNIEVEDDNSYTINNIVVHNCQSWSQSGKKLGFEDPRGKLFFDYVGILKIKQPKYFIFENVVGLTTHANGESFKTIQTLLNDAGYNLFYQIMRSEDHGVPQKRHRIYVVGIRKDINKKFIFPEPEKDFKVIDDILTTDESKYNYYPDDRMHYFESYDTYKPGRVKEILSRYRGKRFNQRKVLYTNGITPTVTTKSSDLLIWHKEKIRQFTWVELESLQGFPPLWTKSLTSQGAVNHVIGNAITWKIAYKIIRNIID